jgi:hypothetical protein
MTTWANADVHVYLDRDNCWRARVAVTYRDEPLRFDVPERSRPGVVRAHGLVPLFLQLAEALDTLRERSQRP